MMADVLSNDDREFIWEVMSEFFLDNRTDEAAEAMRLKRFPIHTLREIFFREVAPVCAPNLLTPAPPVWQGFDAAVLKQCINESLARRRKSIVCWLLGEAAILHHRIMFRDTWRKIEAALQIDP